MAGTQNQPLEYEQVTYNTSSGAQIHNASTYALGFYGKTPVTRYVGVGAASTYAVTSNTTSTQAITFLGSPNSTYTLGLMYHKDAYTFATAALPLMAASEKCVRRTYDGISLRVWQDSDIRNDELLTRIDILYGYAAIRPAWACRVVGTGA